MQRLAVCAFIRATLNFKLLNQADSGYTAPVVAETVQP